jgi:uncharacterized protein YjbI with pentapeptide repeats
MKQFLGKWILWSPITLGGYFKPMALESGAPPALLSLIDNTADTSVFNLYAGIGEGEFRLQVNALAPAATSWLQVFPHNDYYSTALPIATVDSASSFSSQPDPQDRSAINLLWGETLLKVDGNTLLLDDGSPSGRKDLTVTVKTQPLSTYQQSLSAVNADFSNIDLTGADLTGVDFTNANFNGAMMDSSTRLAPSTKFPGATFVNAQLDRVNFSGCDMTGADFTGASLEGALFNPQTTLVGAKFVNVDMSNLDLTRCPMNGADLTGATLTGLNLQGAVLSGAVLANLDLTTLDRATLTNPPILAGSKLQATNLSNSTILFALFNHDWERIDLTNAIIPDLPTSISTAATILQAAESKLSGLNGNGLTGVCLQSAVFNNAWLDGLGLTGADLTGASFIGASLHGTTLTNATLTRATMTGAQLGALSPLFALPTSAISDLNAGQVAPLIPMFRTNGITLSANATLQALAANRVWELTDADNEVYTIRLETQSDNTQVPMVHGPATAASLTGAYMPGAVLTGVNLYAVLASGAQFYGDGARVDGSAILEEVQLNDANLSNLDFTQAQLFGANLSGSHLFNARFNRANLTPSAGGVAANLSSANLPGADFTDAQLYGASLSNAAVAVNLAPQGAPQQGGVYLFSLPYPLDTNTLAQYVAELNSAAAQFSLNPQGDASTLQTYLTALAKGDLAPIAGAFLLQQPPIKLSSQAQLEVVEPGNVWQIVDQSAGYTLWTDVDENAATVLYVAPSLTLTQAAFHHNGITLRWQTSVSIATAGTQWEIDNDSENPQNLDLGYVRFIAWSSGNVLDVYGTAIHVERLGDRNQLQIDTETCNVTVLAVTNMDAETICPNGVKLSVNQTASGETWDARWLRAPTPPSPPTCVPTDYGWCPQVQMGKNASLAAPPMGKTRQKALTGAVVDSAAGMPVAHR